MTFIQSLKLHQFRCYDQAEVDGVGPGFIVLHGPNGAGKTNILEALSLLSPGRGLRGAKNVEMQNHDASQPWAIAAELSTSYGPVKLGTGLEMPSEKRVIRINGENARGQNALLEHVSVVWLTPQMDRLFIDSSGARRRFFDRLIFAFDPGHSGRVSRYENALSQRSKLLKENKTEASWLKGLESQMAETGIAIAAARLAFAEKLQKACVENQDDNFPFAHLNVTGTVEELLKNAPALEVEEMFLYQLEQSRGVDMLTGGAATGPHKADLSVHMAEKNMPAGQCSTGEQKALLTGIILAHAKLIAAERGHPPILLLDEVAAHLDVKRRAALYDVLEKLGGQVWLTGTDHDLFETLEKRAQFFEVKESNITYRPFVKE